MINGTHFNRNKQKMQYITITHYSYKIWRTTRTNPNFTHICYLYRKH